MKCRKRRKTVSVYLDGELDPEKAGETGKHLSQCAECRQELDLLKHADSLLAGLPREEVREDFVRNLMKKAAELQQKRSWSSRLLHFSEYFFDNIFVFKKKNTGTLDEFGDFPPCSLSRVYFSLL